MNFWILSSRLVRTRRDLANNSEKKPKNLRKFAKKIRLKNREIRTNRIKLLLFTFENRRKIKEKSALFGGPYRNSDRQFFYSPIRRAWAISTGFFLDFCTNRLAGVWYRCTVSFCFNPSGPSQYMTLNSNWLLFKSRTCLLCMRTSPNAHIYIHVRICTLKYA